jgi:hypothetical protein
MAGPRIREVPGGGLHGGRPGGQDGHGPQDPRTAETAGPAAPGPGRAAQAAPWTTASRGTPSGSGRRRGGLCCRAGRVVLAAEGLCHWRAVPLFRRRGAAVARARCQSCIVASMVSRRAAWAFAGLLLAAIPGAAGARRGLFGVADLTDQDEWTQCAFRACAGRTGAANACWVVPARSAGVSGPAGSFGEAGADLPAVGLTAGLLPPSISDPIGLPRWPRRPWTQPPATVSWVPERLSSATALTGRASTGSQAA